MPSARKHGHLPTIELPGSVESIKLGSTPESKQPAILSLIGDQLAADKWSAGNPLSPSAQHLIADAHDHFHNVDGIRWLCMLVKLPPQTWNHPVGKGVMIKALIEACVFPVTSAELIRASRAFAEHETLDTLPYLDKPAAPAPSAQGATSSQSSNTTGATTQAGTSTETVLEATEVKSAIPQEMLLHLTSALKMVSAEILAGKDTTVASASTPASVQSKIAQHLAKIKDAITRGIPFDPLHLTTRWEASLKFSPTAESKALSLPKGWSLCPPGSAPNSVASFSRALAAGRGNNRKPTDPIREMWELQDFFLHYLAILSEVYPSRVRDHALWFRWLSTSEFTVASKLEFFHVFFFEHMHRPTWKDADQNSFLQFNHLVKREPRHQAQGRSHGSGSQGRRQGRANPPPSKSAAAMPDNSSSERTSSSGNGGRPAGNASKKRKMPVCKSCNDLDFVCPGTMDGRTCRFRHVCSKCSAEHSLAECPEP